MPQRQPVGGESLVQVIGGEVGAEHAGLMRALDQGDSCCPARVPLCVPLMFYTMLNLVAQFLPDTRGPAEAAYPEAILKN